MIPVYSSRSKRFGMCGYYMRDAEDVKRGRGMARSGRMREMRGDPACVGCVGSMQLDYFTP